MLVVTKTTPNTPNFFHIRMQTDKYSHPPQFMNGNYSNLEWIPFYIAFHSIFAGQKHWKENALSKGDPVQQTRWGAANAVNRCGELAWRFHWRLVKITSMAALSSAYCRSIQSAAQVLFITACKRQSAWADRVKLYPFSEYTHALHMQTQIVGNECRRYIFFPLLTTVSLIFNANVHEIMTTCICKGFRRMSSSVQCKQNTNHIWFDAPICPRSYLFCCCCCSFIYLFVQPERHSSMHSVHVFSLSAIS